jgi:putative ABC transport system permease protein
VSDLRLEPPEAAGDVARLTDSFHLNLTAFGLLSFGVGLFIVHAAIGLAFEQRRATFRTLRAVGLPLRTLMAALAVEVTTMALVAGSSASCWATPSRQRLCRGWRERCGGYTARRFRDP